MQIWTHSPGWRGLSCHTAVYGKSRRGLAWMKPHHMTPWKDYAQAATLQHRLLPTDGYQWQTMAAQHIQGPTHSCCLPLPGMLYLTQIEAHRNTHKREENKMETPVIVQRMRQSNLWTITVTFIVLEVHPLDCCTKWFLMHVYYLYWQSPSVCVFFFLRL